MDIVVLVLLVFLIACAIAACIHKRTLTAIIVFMAYSTIMSIIWAFLESPDLAITEAAVGAGVTSILFFITLKKIREIESFDDNDISELEKLSEELAEAKEEMNE